MMDRVRKNGRRGIAAALLAFAFVPPAAAVVTIEVSTSDGVPGGTVVLGVGLRRDPGDRTVATTQADVIVDTAQMQLVGTCSGSGEACAAADDCGEGSSCNLPCEKEPRLTQHSLSATLPSFQNVPAGQQRFRVAIVDTQFPIDLLTDGALASCVLQVADDADLGPLTVATDRLNVGDERGNVVPAETEVDPGSIAEPTPTPTFTPTQPTATPTLGAATATPTSPFTATPTSGTPTPDTAPCPAERAAPNGPTLYVADQTLAAGATAAVIELRLATGANQVAGTQNDLELPPGIRVRARTNGRPDCTVNAEINKGGTSFAFRPTGCNPANGECSVRALVLSTEDTDPIDDGSVLYRCNVDVIGRGGEIAVIGVILSTPEGTRVPGASGRSGIICVNPPAAVTPTATSTRATPTNTVTSPTPTLTSGSPTPTRTRTSVVAATETPDSGGSGGDGCDCNIAPAQRTSGLSSFWLMVPALLLRWRRWRR